MGNDSLKRRTKIICTVGPVSGRVSVLERMIRTGMDAARLNFSHADHVQHRHLIEEIRSASRKAKKPIPIIADLQGPRIRLGTIDASGVRLQRGERVCFTSGKKRHDVLALPVTSRSIYKDVKANDRILIDDGLIELRVTRIVDRNVEARVIHGGVVSSHKGLNFPDSPMRVPAMTNKDRADARFAMKQGVQWIALSHVTSARPVLSLRRWIQASISQARARPQVMVKIETRAAVEHFDDILAHADGIMIARGDLGVEIEPGDVPIVQKEIIEACRRAGKPVVVATQMLDSMIRSPRPTRAEVNDVASAVFDCASAVMLSGETAVGAYPVEAVRTMRQIIKKAEASCYDDQCEWQAVPF